MWAKKPVPWQKTMDRSDSRPVCYARWLTTVVGPSQRGNPCPIGFWEVGAMNPVEHLFGIINCAGWVLVFMEVDINGEEDCSSGMVLTLRSDLESLGE
jgi:hypothetical protein